MRLRRAKGRCGATPKGVMNRTEAKFAEQLLSLKLAGEILHYRYEAWKLCIVPGLPGKRSAVYYTPDFYVLRGDQEIELIDVKGSAGWEDTARVKIKAAAERWPEFHWVGYTLTKAKTWEREEFS